MIVTTMDRTYQCRSLLVALRRSGRNLRVTFNAEAEDGYRRDESVFGHYISIEDDMAVLARYCNGATMSYHLTAYSPWEGFPIAFNGTEGRLECEVAENSNVSGCSRRRSPPPWPPSEECSTSTCTGWRQRSLATGRPVRLDDLLAL